MKNKDVLIAAALLAGKEDAAAYFSGKQPLNAETAKLDAEFLAFALKLALMEISERKRAPEYEERVTSNGFVSYQSLTKRPMKILTVNGEKAKPSASVEGFSAPVGEITVKYRYFPEGGMEGELDLPQGVNPNAVVLYIAAECAARDRMQDRAEYLSAKYERALFSTAGNAKGSLLPERGWQA
ncbi:MAG: hypothetical protein IKC56_02885 [Clostridia bacterium]|nr:hypothetical protein [Clostridia bacterium]